MRDPKVWHDGRQWLMVLGARTLDDRGEVLLYRGDTLDAWTLVGPIAGSGRGGLGSLATCGSVRTCSPGGDRHVLISCPQGLPRRERIIATSTSAAGWRVTSTGRISAPRAFHELDRGFEFYAPRLPRTVRGGACCSAGWACREENEMSQPTLEHGWIHQMSCPRELFWQDEWLCQRPVAELGALKGEQTRFEGAPDELPALAIDSAWLDLALCGEGRLGFGAVAELVAAGRLVLRRQNWQSGEWEERSAPGLGQDHRLV